MKIYDNFPIWILLIDYLFGMIMWILIFGFLLNLLFYEETKIKIVKLYFTFINKLFFIANKIIPSYLPRPLMPLYLSWVVFMFRFYLLPIVNGIDAIGNLSFPFENLIIKYLNFNALIQNF